ncbi:hypothetical protein ANRL2_01987 [Anaerolineae bacterium]|nr:hypothetical protein ANRL2_01987 [Anaerolineae bacterium]
MSRTIIIANLRYIDPKRKAKGHGTKGLRNMLGYFQYRNDRNDYVPSGRQERWIDQGLGLHYKEILKNCVHLQSQEVLAWSYVISPEPDLMALIPEKERHSFIQTLTEDIIERYYAERGCTAPYSYVVHEARTQDGRPHTHTHVILPGMARDDVEGWQPFKNYRSRGHLALLDEIANDELTQALNLKIGLDWRQAYGLQAVNPEL